ncbi:MAG: MerR family transcriptional regulator, partial [Candidatus Marinimicrobia bacterium]|nr:MerR family transcriptional regulator [Candidatus Neomarinimicrobiota bacterium]
MKYKTIKKLYYSISEISEMLDIKQSVIRYWESEFKELKPQKNRAGNRIYKKDDIAILRMINHYVHGKHLSIQGANEVIMDLKAEGLYKRKLKELNEIEPVKASVEEKVEAPVEVESKPEELIVKAVEEEVESPEPEIQPIEKAKTEPQFKIVTPTEETFIYPLDEAKEEEVIKEQSIPEELIESQPEVPQLLEEPDISKEIEHIESEPTPKSAVIE